MTQPGLIKLDIMKKEVNGKETVAHIFEYTTQLSVDLSSCKLTSPPCTSIRAEIETCSFCSQTISRSPNWPQEQPCTGPNDLLVSTRSTVFSNNRSEIFFLRSLKQRVCLLHTMSGTFR